MQSRKKSLQDQILLSPNQTVMSPTNAFFVLFIKMVSSQIEVMDSPKQITSNSACYMNLYMLYMIYSLLL
jgi:hypothetical protein